MVPNDALINILRSKKYRYKGQSDRMVIWKQAGSTRRVLVRRNASHDEDYARIILKQAGFTDDEIEMAISEALT